MSPGVPQDTGLLQLHVDTVMRSGWDSQGLDNKVVGAHLPLGKRSSTPAGSSNSFHTQHHPLMMKGSLSPVTSALEQQQINNLHRRLDRSSSEPGKAGGVQTNSSRYKTEMCRPFEENGFCKYGDKCQFAHGDAELRNLNRHPKYKTDLCRTFHTIGFCPYGARCHFIHKAEERRAASETGADELTSSQNSLFLDSGSFSQPQPSPHRLLTRPQGLYSGGFHGLGSTAESPSPPASLHGSPTSSAGSFFDDAFTLFPGCYGLSGAKSYLDNLSVGLGCSSSTLRADQGSPGGSSCEGGANCTNDQEIGQGTLLSFSALDTPPVSPVESLAGDLDSLSLSSSSTSPSPAHAAMDMSRFRLPIFEKLSEH